MPNIGSRGNSYKANFGSNYIKKGLNKLNFNLNYIIFDVNMPKKFFRIYPRQAWSLELRFYIAHFDWEVLSLNLAKESFKGTILSMNSCIMFSLEFQQLHFLKFFTYDGGMNREKEIGVEKEKSKQSGFYKKQNFSLICILKAILIFLF